MAEFVNISRYIALGRLGIVLLTASSMADVMAEGFRDPTRPPASLSASSENNRSNGTPDATSVAPVLQSILMSPGRTMAIISGRTVTVGEQVGDARVIKITATEVQLRNGKDQQTLKLFPDVEKRVPSSHVASKAVAPMAQ